MLNRLQWAKPRYWPVWIGMGILWLITRLPIPLQFFIGKGIGRLLYLFPSKFKHITETNIQLCFPERSSQQQMALVKQNFQSLGIGLIETAMAWWLPDTTLRNRCTLKGLEYAEQAFAKGKGIILLSPHLIPLEIVGRLLGMQYSFAVTYRPHKKSLIEYILKRFREKYRVQFIASHEMRNLIRALEKNTAVWYAYDIDGGEKRSVFAPFFNIQTASLTALSRITALTGTTVIPIQFYRNEQAHYEVTLSPPLENFPTDDWAQDAARLNAILEKAIRYKPEQYMWQYKRFKTRPPGEKRFY